MNGPRIGELCAGYGGLSMAVEQVLGGELAWVADNDPGAAMILAHRFPAVKNLGDITTVDWAAVEPVDILTAGFPCFPAGTLIDTPCGYLPIEQITPGQMVTTHKRRHQRVLATMRREDASMVEVRAFGCAPIQTTPEHPFWARRQIRKWNNAKHRYDRSLNPPEWIPAKNLTRDHFVAHPLDDPFGDGVAEVAGRDEAFWWLVGRWLGDGWIIDHPRKGRAASWMRKVMICAAASESDEVAARIKEAGFHATRSPERTVVKFHITSASFVDFLRPYGRGASAKRIPGYLFRAPRHVQAAVVQGWVSADGNSNPNGGFSSTTVSRELAIGMARLWRDASGTPVGIREAAMPLTTVIEGRTVRQRTQYQVRWNPSSKQAVVDGRFCWSPVRGVTPLPGTADVFNLEVKHDNSYVADGVVVHNCQPVSAAGRRKGISDERWLFDDITAAIGRMVTRPGLLVLENVAGLLSANGGDAMGRVVHGLAALGYEFAYRLVRASDAGAPHRRERWFCVAWLAADTGGGELQRRGVLGVPGSAQAGKPCEGHKRERAGHAAGDGRPVAEDTDRAASDQRWLTAPGEAEGGRTWADAGRPGGTPAPADTRSGGLEVRAVESDRHERPAAERGRGNAPANTEYRTEPKRPRDTRWETRERAPVGSGPECDSDPPADADGSGRDERWPEPARLIGGSDAPERGDGPAAHADSAPGGRHKPRRGPSPVQGTAVAERAPQQPGRLHSGGRDASAVAIAWGAYEPAIRRWETILGRPAPRPTEPGRTGERLNPAFVEWMQGLPEGWVTDVPGLSRNAQLKALGNGVVPAQAGMALRMLLARTEAEKAA